MVRRRSIPPRTMRDVWRKRGRVPGPARTRGPQVPFKPPEELRRMGPGASFGIGRPPGAKPKKEAYKPKVYKKRREWAYVTKPFFAKIKEPLIDVFKNAQEVQILVDLGGFTIDEISFGLKDGKYTIYGKHGDQEFKEVIELPKEVDLDNVVESFKNNILDLVLPRKTKPSAKKRPSKEKKSKK